MHLGKLYCGTTTSHRGKSKLRGVLAERPAHTHSNTPPPPCKKVLCPSSFGILVLFSQVGDRGMGSQI